MAEKWDEGTNDSPEVVYEGFSPPTHTQGMMPATSSFVASDGNENNPMVTQPTQPTGFMNVPQVMEEQRESTQPEEADRSRMCFVCCNPVSDKNFETIKSSMNHSHAPLLVLLTDVLGYKLEEGRLHSQVVCKACYHLLDIIDELQQTLTESKTDVRTKFLETVQKLKLKYPRTDKMLKPRCLRCIQMSQSSARKRGRGRGWKGRFDDGRGRGRGRGKSRGHTQSNEGSDNDGEGVMIMEVEPDIDVEDDQSGNQRNTPQKTPPQPSPNIVFDTDPAFFSPDEKLKVGVIREEDGTQVFLCMYCRIRCESALSLKMHVRVYHMPILVYDNGLGTVETRYRMGIKLQNTTATEFSTTAKPFACLFCESSYKLQSSLQSHFREHHSPHKPFQCLECKEGFRRPIELSRHRLYRCPVRKNSFSSSRKER
ncbi:hypothetical protein SK128_004171 [Halocaridina rubra]|uniref:C2H2-type domain-containing protein n=1 Tax=Halocaridina rubra TaxID=373956 RepID=A0AAN8WRW7_HALRR